MTVTIFGILMAAFLGSIPTGYLLGKVFKGIDVRDHGSGNVGATNVFRVMGKLPGAVALFVDMAKGWVAVGALAGVISEAGAHLSMENLQAWMGVAAVCGHIGSPFLGFRGGKGVATAWGVMLGMDPWMGLIAAVIWGVVAWMTRIVSVSSMVAVVVVPVVMIFSMRPASWVGAGAAICVLVVLRHRANIGRLMRGEEPRMDRRVNAK